MADHQRSAERFAAVDLESPVASTLVGKAVVYTHRSPDKPTGNEDAAAIAVVEGAGGVIVVADGMGGAQAGEKAASLAVDAVADAVSNASQETPLRASVLDGIEEANRRVLDLKIGAGCTLAAIEFQAGVIRPYHVGDAAILVFGQRGRLKLETVAHSPVGMAVGAGVLDGFDALHHEDRHLVSNAIGVGEMKIEIGPPIRLAPRDTVLLASDGLFDNLYLAEIIELARKGPLLGAVERLVDAARGRMTHPAAGEPSKPDDLTVVAYRAGGGV